MSQPKENYSELSPTTHRRDDRTISQLCRQGVARFNSASADFATHLGCVKSNQWTWPTPCSEWNVRQLVNHVTRGNLNFASLLRGQNAEGFVRMRDEDALRDDAVASFAKSVNVCSDSFGKADALEAVLDYPLGKITGCQALAIKTTDTLIHTWDLARSIDRDDRLSTESVEWVDQNLHRIYANLPETPVSDTTSNRFFASPQTGQANTQSTQDALLTLLGRSTDWSRT
jgi:uncharacterized protein (TIGR03086 family)